MNVGDYVRIINTLNDYVEIIKIKELNEYDGYLLDERNYQYSTDEIIKSSPQIIDLIECDDIVINRLGEIIRPTSSNIDELKDYWKICKNPIKQILTHEQFESEAYRVEE